MYRKYETPTSSYPLDAECLCHEQENPLDNDLVDYDGHGPSTDTRGLSSNCAVEAVTQAYVDTEQVPDNRAVPRLWQSRTVIRGRTSMTMATSRPSLDFTGHFVPFREGRYVFTGYRCSNIALLIEMVPSRTRAESAAVATRCPLDDTESRV